MDDLASSLRREWRFVLATFAASGVGYLGSSAAPVLVQALIDSGMSHQRAGDLGTIELMTLALCSMLVTPFVTRVSHRRLAVAGVLLAAVGASTSALSTSYLPMIWGRLLLGAGSGLAIAGANAAVAARQDAERIFAVIWTLGGGVTALLTIQLPTLVAGGNYPSGFGVLLVLCVAAAPLLAWLPARPKRLAADSAVLTAVASGDAPHMVDVVREGTAAGRSLASGAPALLVLASVFFYSVSEQALWQFSYDIAVDHGIPYDQVRYLLGVTMFAGLAGGAVAAWLGTRAGRLLPIIVGSLVSLTGRWVYISATTPELLVVGSLLWGLGFYFVSPYQMGVAAALDRRGRLAVAATALTNLGYGVGPTLGGRIRQYQIDLGLDHTILVIVIAGATLLSLLLILPVVFRLERDGAGPRPRGGASPSPV